MTSLVRYTIEGAGGGILLLRSGVGAVAQARTLGLLTQVGTRA
jgi:hypothetical protein